MTDVNAYLTDVSEGRRRRQRVLFFGTICLFVTLVAGGGGWLVVYSPIFTERAIGVHGNREVTREQILDLAYMQVLSSAAARIVGFDNLLAWPEAFSGEALRFAPRLEAVRIEKDYASRKIVIRVEERDPFGIWCFMGQMEEAVHEYACFWFDREGVAFRRAPLAEGNLIRVVKDYSQRPVRLGDKVLAESFLGPLRSIFEALAASGVSVREMRLEDLGREELRATTEEGPALYFSLRFPADQAGAVIQSLRADPAVRFRELEYVDFRSENRAYYK